MGVPARGGDINPEQLIAAPSALSDEVKEEEKEEKKRGRG